MQSRSIKVTNIDPSFAGDTFSNMKRQIGMRLLAICAIASALLVLGACSTPETRISEKPEAYRSLSATDQALVSQGKIHEGMSRDAVYIAWGAPNQRAEGRNRGRSVETWIYFSTASDSYSGSFGYGYGGFGGGFGGFGGGFGGGYGGFGGFGGFGGSRLHQHRSGRLHRHIYYDPFYDPFFWSRNRVITYPDRTVSFQNGRVIAFQFLPPPRGY